MRLPGRHDGPRRGPTTKGTDMIGIYLIFSTIVIVGLALGIHNDSEV